MVIMLVVDFFMVVVAVIEWDRAEIIPMIHSDYAKMQEQTENLMDSYSVWWGNIFLCGCECGVSTDTLVLSIAFDCDDNSVNEFKEVNHAESVRFLCKKRW